MRVKEEKLKETLIFLIKLCVLSIPLYLVIFLRIDLGFLQDFITFHLVHFLNFVGVESHRQGFNIILSNSTIVINKDCTGWKGLLFFTALVLSTKVSRRKMIFEILVGLPSLFSVNIFRIVLMIWIGSSSVSNLFSFFHDLLWQFSMVFIVLMLWFIWWNKEVK